MLLPTTKYPMNNIEKYMKIILNCLLTKDENKYKYDITPIKKIKLGSLFKLYIIYYLEI